MPKSYKPDLETKAQKNRRLMPQTAVLIDQLRNELGDIKVLYAEEGDYRMGTPLDRSKLVKLDIPPPEETKKRKKK